MLAGYVVGLGLVIAVGQVPALLGLSIDADGFFAQVEAILRSLSDANPWTVATGVGTLAAAARAAGRRAARARRARRGRGWRRRRPPARPGDRGRRAARPDRRHAPRPGAAAGSSSTTSSGSRPGALGVALLAYAESIAAARRFAATHGYEVDANRELVAVGSSNVAVGLAQGFPVDASMSRTSVADGAGQRTQLAGLLNAGLVVLTIALLMGFFADLPKATLAAVVIAAVLPLMRTGELRRLQRIDQVDFAFAAICLVGVLVLGVLDGIVVAVLASLVALVVRSFRPHTAVLGRLSHRAARATRTSCSATSPGTRGSRRSPASSSSGSTRSSSSPTPSSSATPSGARSPRHRRRSRRCSSTRVRSPTSTPPGSTCWSSSTPSSHDRGIALRLARVKSRTRDILERADVVELLGPEGIQPSVRAGVDAFLRRKG